MAEPQLRIARKADLRAILTLLVADPLGKTREDPEDAEHYAAALAEIEADPNNDLFVLDLDGEVVGCAQLTIIPGLSRHGARRAQVEGVRIAPSLRGQGLGHILFDKLIAVAKARNCVLMQLATDKRRIDAHRFYDRLGFTASHEGYKLGLADA